MKVWQSEARVTTRAKFTAFKQNVPETSKVELYNLLSMKKVDYDQALKQYTPKQQQVAKNYRAFTEFFFERTNKMLVLMGEKPMKSVDGYMRRIVQLDPTGANYKETTGDLKFLGIAKQTYNPTLKSRDPRAQVEVIRDPVRAILNMSRYDLQTMYLHNPLRIMNARVGMLKNMGMIDKTTQESLSQYASEILLGRPTALTKKWNKSLDDGFIGTAVEGVLKQFGRTAKGRPLDVIANTFGRTLTASYMGLRPSLAIRNMLQSMYMHGMVSTKSMAKALTLRDPALLKNIKRDSDVVRISVGSGQDGLQEIRGGLAGGFMKIFHASHKANVNFSANASYWEAVDYIVNPKNVKLGWSDKVGRDLRKRTGKQVFSRGEINNITKHVEWNTSHTQFIYHATGMGSVYSNPAGRIAFKFQSYPMNYIYKYLGEMGHRLWKGSPGWDKTGKMKLPLTQRAGIFKHFVGMAGIIAVLDKMGLDYSSSLLASWSPSKAEERGSPFKGGKLGVANFRPSVGVRLFTATKDMWSDDAYIRGRAKKDLDNLKWSFAPGFLAFKDIQKAIERKSFKPVFLKTAYKRKKSARKNYPFYSPPKPFAPVRRAF